MKTYRLRSFLIFTLFFVMISALIVFSFYDLEATQKLYIGDTFFSTIFAYLGKLPAFVILFFASSVLSKCVDVDYETSTFALKWFYRIIILFSGFLFYYSILENFFFNSVILVFLSIAFGVATSVISILIFCRINREKLLKIEKWCMLSLIVVIATFFTVTAAKMLIGRSRYVEILAQPEKFSFKPWFSFDFFGEGNSFPSGHVGLAATLCLIPLLLKTLDCKKIVKIPSFILCVLFILFTLVSRVTAGQHFMTDVLFSLLICFLYYFLFRFLLYRNNKLYFTNENKVEKKLNLGYQKNDATV